MEREYGYKGRLAEEVAQLIQLREKEARSGFDSLESGEKYSIGVLQRSIRRRIGRDDIARPIKTHIVKAAPPEEQASNQSLVGGYSKVGGFSPNSPTTTTKIPVSASLPAFTPIASSTTGKDYLITTSGEVYRTPASFPSVSPKVPATSAYIVEKITPQNYGGFSQENKYELRLNKILSNTEKFSKSTGSPFKKDSINPVLPTNAPPLEEAREDVAAFQYAFGKEAGNAAVFIGERQLKQLSGGKRNELPPSTVAAVKEAGFITGQVAPYFTVIGTALAVLDAGVAVQKGDYGTAITYAAIGGAFRIGEAAIPHITAPATKYFSSTYKSTGGYKNTVSQKFVSDFTGKVNEYGLKAANTFTQKVVPIATAGAAVGYIYSPVLTPEYNSEQIISESKNTGYGILGYKLAVKSEKILQTFLYNQAATKSTRIGDTIVDVPTGKLQRDIDYRLLEAPDVASGKTPYPKDTLVAKKFLQRIKNEPALPEYFDKKIFKDQVITFNASPITKAPRYRPEPGSSEYSGLFSKPFGASLTFAIPKSSRGGGLGISGSNPSVLFNSPSVEAIYSKNIKIFDVSGKGFSATESLPPGNAYILAKGKLRTKPESEVITPPTTVIKRIETRYFTQEKNLSLQRGYPFGIKIAIPEVQVSQYQNGKLISQKTIVPRTLQELKQYAPDVYSRATAEYKAPVLSYSTNKSSQTKSISSSVSFSTPSYSPSSSQSKSSGSSVSYSAPAYRYENISSRNSPSYSPPSPPYRPPPSYPNVSYSYSPPSYPSSTSSSREGSSSSPRKSYSPPSPPYRPPTRTPPRLPQSKAPSFSANNKVAGFQVQTRKGGKIITLPRIYSRENAFAAGSRIAAQTLRASFRIKPAGQITNQTRISASEIPFYKSKKGFYVEPRSFRLSTRTEQTEIKSYQSRRRFL